MFIDNGEFNLLKYLFLSLTKMLKLDVSNISPRSDREATAGTLFQFIVYRNKKGKTRDGLAQSIFITLYLYYKILPVRENFKTG